MNTPISYRLPTLGASVVLVLSLLQPVGLGAAEVVSGCDFDRDGYADLAVGAPGQVVQGHDRAGGVNVLYGTATGPDASRDLLLHQGTGGVQGAPQAGEEFGYATTCGDFDGDGYSDLAVGTPGDEVSGKRAAGSVSVYFGSGSGLAVDAARNLRFHQSSPGVSGGVEAGDRFGAALSAGDIHGDGIADLVIGVPGENIGSVANAGAVHIRSGELGGFTVDTWLSQDRPAIAGKPEAGDGFGSSLAVGDFDADGFADVAVGVPGESIGSIAGAGMANVVFGVASGYDTSRSMGLSQSTAGVAGSAEARDGFASSLATGDFNGDGFDDLAVGVPFEDIGAVPDAGMVHVLHGSSAGPDAAVSVHIGQFTPGVAGRPEAGDNVGAALATGQTGAGATGWLVIGAPGESIGTRRSAGMVHAIPGSGAGLVPSAGAVWHQDTAGVQGSAEPGDGLGSSVAIGDFDGDGVGDLSIGVPGEDLGLIRSAGMVNVLFGDGSGLTAAGDLLIHQELPSVSGSASAGDMLGRSVASASSTWDPVGEFLDIQSRSTWTSRSPIVARLQEHSGSLEYLTVHHAGNQDNTVTGPARWRSWQAFHMDTRGWGDLAYHYIIGIDGTVSEARDLAYRGDTGTNYNPDRHFLVVLEGNFEKQDPTPAQLDSLRLVLAWASVEFDVPLDTIGGHRDHAATACPGTNLYQYIVTDLPSDVAGLIASGGVSAG